jgi:hypothetical protein
MTHTAPDSYMIFCEEEIGPVMQAAVGMYGHLQGIAGKSLKETEGPELRALDELSMEKSPAAGTANQEVPHDHRS